MEASRKNAKPSFMRRVLACLVSAALAVAFTPVVAWGASATDVKYLDESGAEKTCASATVVESSTEQVTWSAGWYVVQGNNVTISQRVTVNGDVHLILADGCSLTVNGGIQVQDDDNDLATPSANSLTIYGHSEPDVDTNGNPVSSNMAGKLTIQNVVENNACIGGDGSRDVKGNDGGAITINGGVVEATVGGSGGGAGIGGGGSWVANIEASGGSGGTITINGGTVKVVTANGGAGIGGGKGHSLGGEGGKITINGGTVNIQSESGACIGGGAGLAHQSNSNRISGKGGDGGQVTITGGSVTGTVVGGGGAGIGGGRGSGVIQGSGALGKGGSGGRITITGGSVTVNVCDGGGAGIGGGSGDGNGSAGGDGGSVVISGGAVKVTGGQFGGAGIGGGASGTQEEGTGGNGGQVTITGGAVSATGANGGAGIGGGGGGSTTQGNGGSGGRITISGGIVSATGGGEGAGIGNARNCIVDDGCAFSTGGNGNAVVFASSVSDQDGKSNNTWSGVIFEGVGGSVYGSPTLLSDLTYPNGTGSVATALAKSLTVPQNSTLTIAEGKTLTVPQGSALTVTAGGTIKNNGTIAVDTNGTLSVANQGTIKNIVTLKSGDKVIGTTSYDYNAGGGVTDLPVSVPGYTIISNWFDNSNLTGSPVSSIDNTGLTAMTFYADCTVNQFVITYELGGGTNDPANPTVYTVETETFTLRPATKSGYTFAGWYAGNTKVEQIPKGTTGSITLTAKWYVPSSVPQAALDVIKLINAIGEVTLESKDAIEAARTGYDALTSYEKLFIPAVTYDKLEAAEIRYADLVVVAPVEEALAVLPASDELKAKDAKKAVKAAKRALKQVSKLTEDQRSLVDEQLVANAEKVIERGTELIARADKKAVKRVKNKAFSVKYGYSKVIYFKTKMSAAGTKVVYKKASGSKYITVTKAGKVTAKKGLNAGKTYTAKVKVTCGKSWKYVTVTVRVQ